MRKEIEILNAKNLALAPLLIGSVFGLVCFFNDRFAARKPYLIQGLAAKIYEGRNFFFFSNYIKLRFRWSIICLLLFCIIFELTDNYFNACVLRQTSHR